MRNYRRSMKAATATSRSDCREDVHRCTHSHHALLCCLTLACASVTGTSKLTSKASASSTSKAPGTQPKLPYKSQCSQQDAKREDRQKQLLIRHALDELAAGRQQVCGNQGSSALLTSSDRRSKRRNVRLGLGRAKWRLKSRR